MSTYDRDLHHKLQKIQSIDDRVARQERATRNILILLIVFAASALALLVAHIPSELLSHPKI